MQKYQVHLITFCLIIGLTFNNFWLFAQDTTATWVSCINFYREFAKENESASLRVFGQSDAGRDLHCMIFNNDGEFDPMKFNRDKVVVLINNNIHPGEPDGVEASMRLCKELGTPGHELAKLLDRLIICIIPMYNVDGAMVRGSYSRANQVGPKEYGFRGNALNLDLNRDFIKCDSKNALAFNDLFTAIMPHILVDTHVSNGADYQHTLTLITTQSDKLGYAQGEFLRNQMEPALYESLAKTPFQMVPYVHTMGRTPESGIEGFLETSRFATGYAALFGTIGLTTETHMLKPFAQRVEATFTFLDKLLLYAHANQNIILEQYQEGKDERADASAFALKYELDSLKKTQIRFDGYQALDEPALLGTGQRLRYDRQSKWSKKIPYFGRYRASQEVVVPEFYILPSAWHRVIERLDANHVIYKRLRNDTIMQVRVSYAEKFQTSTSPYEGHYYHHHIECRDTLMSIQFYSGDLMISTRQNARKYLAESLEPNSAEGFFAWNFFDSMLQQKEWFSDYVFEDIAAELLRNDAKLKKEFDQMLSNNKNLAEDHWQQLYWIYKRSPYYEKSAYRVPVYRID